MISTQNRVPWWIAAAAVVVSLGFAAFTGHMWEDYLITFRASLNLATGNGLVFQPGERVHSFTSPIGTLLPALFALGGGENVEIRALWGLRIVSAFALGSALWMAVRTLQRDGLVTFAIAAAGLALVLDPKIVDFSMNGMESGLMVFFVVLTWNAFVSGAKVWPCALGCAGLQWTRPDGCVFFAAIALGWMLLGARADGFSWRTRTLLLIRVVALGGAIYLPWFIFAWSYYGSPVPHTIIAKAQNHALAQMTGKLALYPWQLLFGDSAVHDVFKPTYHAFGGWPAIFSVWARVLACGAALTWIWPRVPLRGRMASAAFFLGGFYISYIPQAPWYYPGWQSIGWIAWAYLLHTIWQVRPVHQRLATIPHASIRTTAAVIIVIQASLFICVAWQVRTQQTLIEDAGRREVGRWLAKNAQPGNTVFLECLGYIGFYSGLKMLDYPGLASREVVAARRAGHWSYAQIIGALRPDWLVLRPWEASMIVSEAPELDPYYVYAQLFDHRAEIDRLSFVPGRGYLRYDAAFQIYRRIEPTRAPLDREQAQH
jgi:hypothetical protein